MPKGLLEAVFPLKELLGQRHVACESRVVGEPTGGSWWQ